jgi:hypothetical protein
MTAPSACPGCRAPLVATASYCHRCGRAVTPGGAGERTPWIVAWCLVLLALGGIAYFVVTKNRAPDQPDMANVGAAPGGPGGSATGGTPPDISQMSPRERFLRLSDRIMDAAEKGDSAMAARFAPMAITAYGMLDGYDPDVRFHAGVIHLRLGEYTAALALADTIQAEAKDHLLGYLLRAETAQARGDRAALAQSRRAYLQHFDAQMASGRPEYREHRAMLEEFRNQASK